MVFDLLKEWDKVIERRVEIPDIPNLRAWCTKETKLGNPTLKAYCEAHDEPDMHRSLAWSKAVNDSVADIVRGVPPFPHVRESLEKAFGLADILVCSATPGEALIREWQEHEIDRYTFAIAGQEAGSKAEHIAMAAAGKYELPNMLMIGDALGDLKAAKANKALFFPINPGDEEDSWKLFYEEALDKFIAGEYAGEYEAALIKKFDAYLPDTPPWKKP
jgi:phosphoglycolate phosphatase-like HAD superfamily hydrolase